MSPSLEEVRLPAPSSESGERLQRVDEPLRLLHHHPGYLRIQADAFVEPADDSLVAAARTATEALGGVRSWSHTPKTGSVVVEYDPDSLEADDLLKHIAKSAGFSGVENATTSKMNRQELVGVFMDAVQDVNQVVRQMTGDRLDLRELVPAALAATSVVSFVLNDERGRLPTWDSAIYHSYRIFMQWHRREARARERVARQEEESRTSGDGSGNVR
jgi:heavy-metal-associated domain-containing protein